MELRVVAMETVSGHACYLWSDGIEVVKNLQTGEWSSHQVPHPSFHPSAFAPRVRATDSLDLTLAPDIAVDD